MMDMSSFIVCKLLFVSLMYLNIHCALTTVNVGGILTQIASIVPPMGQCESGQSYFTHTQYNTFFTSVKASGLSLIGYEGVVQNSIYLKSSIKAINTSHIQIGFSCQSETLFNVIRFSYIIIKDPLDFIQIYSDCYLCQQKSTLTGNRKWSFLERQHLTTYSDHIKIYSSLSAFNASNVQTKGLNFKLTHQMNTINKFINHTIHAFQWTNIVTFCVTTIVYDFSKTSPSYKILVQVETKFITQADQATKIQPTQYTFEQPNSMFYGISAININFQPRTKQLLLFDLQLYNDLNQNFQSNQNLVRIQLSAFFIRQLNCPTSQYFDPQKYDCVLACPSGQGPNSDTLYCQKCHQTCETCNGKGQTMCFTCNSAILNKFRGLVPNAPDTFGTCECLTGYIQPSDGSVTCLSCAELIQNCLQCSNSTDCTLCDADYVFNSTLNRCVCSDPALYLTQTQCMKFPGCIQIQYSTNIDAYCSICNQTQNFQFVVDDNTCKCKQNFKYSPFQDKCVDICGDGVIIDLPCDDGNIINGDGCSSTCQIETGYFCADKTVQQPSLCMEKWNFNINFLYCQRDISSNVGTFTFVLSPLEPKISHMNLMNCLNFSFPSTIISYQYDPASGQLKVNTEFLESIEGQSHFFTLNMKNVKKKTDDIKANFIVNGLNSWMIRDEYSGIYKFIIYGIVIICLVIWILAIVASILGYKHLSIELVFPVQSIYLVLMEQTPNAPGLRALDLMKFINGYNSLNGFKIKEIVSVNDTRYSAPQYLQNLNFFIIIDAFLIVTIFLLKFIQFKKQKITNQLIFGLQQIHEDKKISIRKCQTKEEIIKINEKFQQKIQYHSSIISKQKEKIKPIQKFQQFFGFRFCNLIVLFIIQPSIYYLGDYVIYGADNLEFSALLNILASVICFSIGMASLWIEQEMNNYSIIMTLNQKLKYSYSKLIMMWFAVCALVIIVFESFQVKAMVIIPIILFTLIAIPLILRNPYKNENSKKLRFILPIVQHFTLIIPPYLLWIGGFLNTLDPLIFFITTVIILCCCFVGIVITSVRMFYEWKYFAFIQKKLNLEQMADNENEEREKLSISKDQQKDNENYQTIVKSKEKGQSNEFNERDMNYFQTNKAGQKEKNVQKMYESVSSNQDNNEQDIELIKRRLRSELKSKRAIREK